jgi:hypothetical protein
MMILFGGYGCRWCRVNSIGYRRLQYIKKGASHRLDEVIMEKTMPIKDKELITDLREQIESLTYKIDAVKITSMVIYKHCKDETTKLLALTKQYNLLNSRAAKLSDNKLKTNYKIRSNADKLYKHICDLEEHNVVEQFPSKKLNV